MVSQSKSATFEGMVIRLDRSEFMPPVEFELICICSQLREYRLAHLLNARIGLILSREEDLNSEHAEADGLATYARFLFDDELICRSYTLLGNQPLTRPEVTRPGDLFGTEQTQPLMQELSKADYLLLIYGDITGAELSDLCNTIRSLPDVVTAYPSDPRILKDISPIALI